MGLRSKILIVDRDELALISLERLLESEGYSTSTTWSGQEALELLAREEFDIMLLDCEIANSHSSAFSSRIGTLSRPPMLIATESRDGQARLPEVLGTGMPVCKWNYAQVCAMVRNYSS